VFLLLFVVVCCLLFVVVCCLLFVVFVVFCLLFVVCCLLFETRFHRWLGTQRPHHQLQRVRTASPRTDSAQNQLIGRRAGVKRPPSAVLQGRAWPCSINAGGKRPPSDGAPGPRLVLPDQSSRPGELIRAAGTEPTPGSLHELHLSPHLQLEELRLVQVTFVFSTPG